MASVQTHGVSAVCIGVGRLVQTTPCLCLGYSLNQDAVSWVLSFMEGRLLDVQYVLADVLKRAQYVLAGDAYLTNRSLAYFSMVLSEVNRVALVRNNIFQPYDRKVHWVPMEKNKELTDKAAMGKSCFDRLLCETQSPFFVKLVSCVQFGLVSFYNLARSLWLCLAPSAGQML